jgi:hypothetical protein
MDLGGNLSEYVLDDFQPYSERCGLGYGLTRSPVCSTGVSSPRIIRGSSWATGLAEFGPSARRQLAQPAMGTDLPTSAVGFRCTYSGE